MPLNPSQKELIEASISHLLDFPGNSKELISEFTKLSQALQDSKDINNDYNSLVNVLLNPEDVFHQLEKRDASAQLLVGEVQEEIIDLIHAKLAIAAKKANIILAKVGWDPIAIKQKIIKPENKAKKFVGRPQQVMSTALPWQEITEPGKIFTASLCRSEDGENVMLQVDVELPDGMQICFTNDFFPVIAAFPTEEDLFRYLIPSAMEESYVIAADKVIEFLAKCGITGQIGRHVSLFKKVITEHLYLELLIAREISFKTLINLNYEEAENLLNPTVKILLANKIIGFREALGLTALEIRVASCYIDLLVSRKLNFLHLASMTEEQSKMLVLPVIMNVVKAGKVSFTLARYLPLVLRDVFLHPLYTEYFTKENIPWPTLFTFTTRECHFLLNTKFASQIANLIKNRILFLFDLMLMTDSSLERLKNKTILELLLIRKISINDIQFFSKHTMFLLLKHPYIKEWLLNNLINIQDVTSAQFVRLYVKVYSNRLVALNSGRPFVLHGRCDTSQSIKNELPLAANFLAIRLEDLEVLILDSFRDEFRRKATGYADNPWLLLSAKHTSTVISSQLHEGQPIRRLK